MPYKRNRRVRRRNPKWKDILIRQILVSLLILLFILVLKKMDIALTNRVMDTFNNQISINYTVTDMKSGVKAAFHRFTDGTVAMVANIKNSNRHVDFGSPADENGSLAASTGSGEGKSIQYSAFKELQVYAAAGGTVIEIVDSEDGNSIKISHGNEMFTVYKGCTDVYVKEFEKVRKGQIIGTVQSGEDKILSFEIWVDGKLADPSIYMEF